MEVVKYNNTNLLLVVQAVIDLSGKYFCTVILKFILKDIYPELRGKIRTDWPEESAYELINKVDDPLITIMRLMACDIQCPALLITSLYPISEEGIVDVDILLTQAHDIYWAVIVDNFADGDELDDYEDTVYRKDLDVNIRSMIRLTHHLITVIETGQTDFESLSIGSDRKIIHRKADYLTKPHAKVYESLFDLVDKLEKYHDRFWRKNYDLTEFLNENAENN